jgi:hypothetical protein
MTRGADEVVEVVPEKKQAFHGNDAR